jgi:hypothetical protein
VELLHALRVGTLRVSVLLALTAAAQPSCSSNVCPTIACTPELTLTFATPIGAPYHLYLSVGRNIFEAYCPAEEPGRPGPTFRSCDSTVVIIDGIDLGHGANSTIDLTVAIDSGPQISVTASLTGISNSRGCDLVCYMHSGVINN